MSLFDILITYLIISTIFNFCDRYKKGSFYVNLIILTSITGTMYENAYGDYTAYRLGFEELKFSLEIPSGEIGLNYLNLLIKLFTDKFTIAFFIYMLIINFFILRFIYKNSKNIGASILMYTILGGYATSTNIMRQFLALSIYLMAIDALLKNNKKNYIIISIIAFCFHKSIAIAVVFTLFVKFFNDKLYEHYIIFFLISNAVIIVEPVIRKVGIEFLYGSYSMDSFDYGSSILHYLVQLFFVGFYYFSRKYINNEEEKFYSNIVMIGLAFTLLSQNMVLYARFATYFTFFNCINFVNIGHKLPIKVKRISGYLIILLLLVYYKFLTLRQFESMSNYLIEYIYKR